MFDTEHGFRGLIYSVALYVLSQIAFGIVKAIWAFANRNKGPTKQQFEKLDKSLEATQKSFDEYRSLTSKIQSDLHRSYLFLKVIAGDKWPIYRRQVEEMEKEERTF